MEGVVMYPCACLMMMSLCVVFMTRSGNGAQERTDIFNGDEGYLGVISNASEKCNKYERRIGCDLQPLCFCDEHCKQFNDCCHSSQIDRQTSKGDALSSQGIAGNDSHSNSTISDVFSKGYHVCVERSSLLAHSKYFELYGNGYILQDGFWMVAKCPPSWNDVGTKHLCEASADESEPMLHLPVVSSADTTSFRNIYCAVCHGVPLATITSWNVTVSASANVTLETGNYSAGLLTFFKGFDGMRNVKFVPWHDEVRRCLTSVVDGCPADYGDDYVIEACRSYMAAVAHPVTHVTYRNWYCALCNDALDYELDICGRILPIPTKLFTTSLTAFVDLQGTELSLSGTNMVIENTCGKNEFLDPFSLRCRILRCPEGLLLANGVCVEQEIYYPAGITDLNCISPGKVELEISMCLTEDTSDPCVLWEECIGLHTTTEASVWMSGLCQKKLKSKDEFSCAPLAGINLTVNTTSLVVEDALRGMGLLNGSLAKRCSSLVSIPQVVVKRGCLPYPHSKCHDYHSEGDRSVYLSSWNKSETLYLRNLNSVYPLEETLDQIIYNPSSEGHFNITHSLTLCGDPIDHFNCSLVKVNSSAVAKPKTAEKPISDEDHVLLETGEALVCRNRVSTLPSGPLSVSGVTIVTVIGIIVSMIALVASFITYVVFPSLRNLPGQCVMSLIVAVFSAQLLIMVTGDGVARSVGEASCAALAVLLHYTCLTTFSWTNALAFYLTRTLGPGAKPSAARQHRNTFMYFNIFSWGAPLVIVLICLILHFIPNLGLAYGVSVAEAGIRSCSITDRDVEIAAFVVPISVSLLANAVFFVRILVGFTFRKAPSTNLYSKEARKSRVRRDALISIKVGFLLAFTWIFGFLATGFQSEFLLYVFSIMTSLQGVYIFLAFTFTQQVRALWREKLGLKRPGSSRKKTATQRKYLQKPKKVVSSTADNKDLCKKHSPPSKDLTIV